MNSEVWWFYLPSLFRATFPWSLLLSLGIYGTLRCAAQEFRSIREKKFFHLGLIWTFVGVAFFSLPSGKRHSYLLPLLPGVAIYLGLWIERFLFNLTDQGFSRAQRGIRIFGKVLFIFCFAQVIFFDVLRLSELLNQPLLRESGVWLAQRASTFQLVLLLPLVVYVGTGLPRFRDFIAPRLLAIWFMLLFAINVPSFAGLGVKAHLKQFKEVAETLSTRISSSGALTVYKFPFDEYCDPALYYLKRAGHGEVVLVNPEVGLLPCENLVLTKLPLFKDIEILAKERGVKLTEIDRFREIPDRVSNSNKTELVLYSCS